MKRVTLLVTFILAVFISGSAQITKPEADPVGIWKFEAPYAPEGFNSGIIVISREEMKHIATLSFTGSDYKLNGENVIVEKDTVTFSINLEGQVIKVSLKGDSDAKMVGKAVYTDGEVPLTLTKTVTPSR